MMNPVDAVKRWNESWNANDVEAVVATYAADAVFRHPMVPEPMAGREAIRAFLSGIGGAFTEVDEVITRTVVQGNTVAAEVHHRARNTGEMVTPMGALPATGRAVEMLAAHFFVVDDDGLIKEEQMSADGLAFMTQLGQMPPPPA